MRAGVFLLGLRAGVKALRPGGLAGRCSRSLALPRFRLPDISRSEARPTARSEVQLLSAPSSSASGGVALLPRYQWSVIISRRLGHLNIRDRAAALPDAVQHARNSIRNSVNL